MVALVMLKLEENLETHGVVCGDRFAEDSATHLYHVMDGDRVTAVFPKHLVLYAYIVEDKDRQEKERVISEIRAARGAPLRGGE